MIFNHVPVLLNECLDALNIKEDGIYVDATLGRAGHSAKILEKCNKGHLYCFDQDQQAIEEGRLILEKINHNFTIFHDNFSHIYERLAELGLEGKIDGIMFDLGVSSPQFDDPSRGFSYKVDARLDMRMDQNNPLDAYQIVNNYKEEELRKIFFLYGEDKYSNAIAHNIVKYRQDKAIETTLELVEIIKKSKPKKELSKPGHPAKQIFQALRIEVNKEYDALRKGLLGATKLLKHGGRLLVISFHSGEDKIIKSYFRELCVVVGDRLNIPSVNKLVEYKLINHKPIIASEEELAKNHRSKSAKLRIIERL